MSVEPKWLNVREPTFELPMWLVLALPVPVIGFGLWGIVHGHALVGRAVVGVFSLVWGLIFLRFHVGNRGAVLSGSGAIGVGFNLYPIVCVVLAMILGVGQLLRALDPGSQTIFFFNLLRDFNGESELVAATTIAALSAIVWGDVRWRWPIVGLVTIDGSGFYCLYLAGVRGVTLPISTEGMFWILQAPILLTIFSSMVSIESRKYWDMVAARTAIPRTFASR
jgi:hypothetical protein